jgi:hypothetical protein
MTDLLLIAILVAFFALAIGLVQVLSRMIERGTGTLADIPSTQLKVGDRCVVSANQVIPGGGTPPRTPAAGVGGPDRKDRDRIRLARTDEKAAASL